MGWEQTDHGEDVVENRNGEKRYQWAIMIMLVIMGFLSGAFVQNERLKEQVIINTVEIQALKDVLAKIEAKLDTIIAEKN